MGKLIVISATQLTDPATGDAWIMVATVRSGERTGRYSFFRWHLGRRLLRRMWDRHNLGDAHYFSPQVIRG